MLTIVIFTTQLVLHSVFVVPAVPFFDSITERSILVVWLVVYYVLWVLIIYDFCWISCTDPADPILLNPELARYHSYAEMDDCSQCGPKLLHSYHCNRCGRCTDEFDHHCKFLNNCIGGKNYENFLRLLIVTIVEHAMCIGQGLWVFIRALTHGITDGVINYWVIIAPIAISGLLLIFTIVLLSFHCYISCCISMTTLEWIYYDS